MRIDLYTKTMLTLIVLLLATIACHSVIQPNRKFGVFSGRENAIEVRVVS